jgi:type VI secretion system protein ImpL
MSWHASQLKYALGLGGIMSFYGVVSLIVLMLPPGTFGGRSYQIVVIGLVLLTLPFALIIMFVSSRRAKKKARLEADAGAAKEDGAASAPPPAAAGTFANITSGTEEAVQFLRSSNLGNGGRDAVYSLPWYIVAGAPRAGKSSLVLSSNLNFQTLPSQPQSEQKFIRPTGSVDWRVTSDAVFVDTAGRYQTEGIDGEEWASLLETIKKYRGNRPVDGFLLVVNAESILKSDERQIEELAKVLRARLDETLQRLKVRFPVYVVFTHADAIEGFSDSFSSSKNEDKTLVWGATIPIEKSENAQALFDGEYEVLHNSLMKRRIVRLSAPFPPVRQLRIFNFPLHFGSARRKFGSFINALFRPNPFSENPFLRGFYFTASPVGRSNGNAVTVGNPYFTERFFKDVVLRDRDLVRTAVEARKRPPFLGWALTIAGCLLMLGFLVMAGISLASNRQLLAEAELRGRNMIAVIEEDKGKNPLDKKPDAVRAEIEKINEMRGFLAQLDNWDRERPPLHMRFGLYSGEKVFKEDLLKIYFNVVGRRFAEPAVKKLEAELAKFGAGRGLANPGRPTEEEEKNFERHLNMLKAYLMLSRENRDKAQASDVESALKEFWVSESKTPPESRDAAEQILAFWAKQVDRDDIEFPVVQPDAKIVAAARNKLKDYPPHLRYLSRKASEVSSKVDAVTVTGLLTKAGSNPNYMTGRHTVPGAYTRAGYDQMIEAIRNADEEMKKDDWIMGDAGRAEQARDLGSSQIEEKYLANYAAQWTAFVSGIDVKEFRSRNEAVEAIQAFSAEADSPMRVVAEQIAANTHLSAEPESGWLWSWIKSLFSSGSSETVGNTAPENTFKPLFDFVGSKDKKSQFVDYAAVMRRLYNNLSKDASSDSVLKKLGEDLNSDAGDKLEIKKFDGAISGMVAPLQSTAGGQEIGALLMEPIARLRTLMGAGGRESLSRTWNEQLLPAAKRIERGYPFDDSGGDADLKALASFLSPGAGELSKFYDEKLKNFFEVSNGQYRVKQGSEMPFTEEFVAYLNSAFALREAMFGTGATAKFEYEFALRPVPDTVIEITIDGQKLTSDGTGSLRGTFPGSGETGVLMRLASGSGPAALPPPPSANSSNSSVSTLSGSPGTAGANDKVFQGQWGLFKFVDAGSPEKQAGGEYLLKYSLGGKSVTATIKPIGGDLFNKNMFKQVRAPQTLLK